MIITVIKITPLVKVKSYPFNTPVIDNPYTDSDSIVNSVDYYHPNDPRYELSYSFRVGKRRCLEGNVYYKNL